MSDRTFIPVWYSFRQLNACMSFDGHQIVKNQYFYVCPLQMNDKLHDFHSHLDLT